MLENSDFSEITDRSGNLGPGNRFCLSKTTANDATSPFAFAICWPPTSATSDDTFLKWKYYMMFPCERNHFPVRPRLHFPDRFPFPASPLPGIPHPTAATTLSSLQMLSLPPQRPGHGSSPAPRRCPCRCHPLCCGLSVRVCARRPLPLSLPVWASPL
jgi:hypothetical protein